MIEGAKVIVEVSRGLIPNKPDTVWRKTLTQAETEDLDAYMLLMGEAMARTLAGADPNVANWLRFEWVWI